VRQYEPAFAGLPAYAHDALLRAYLQTAAHGTLSDEAFSAYMTPWRGAEGQAGFYRQIAQMDQTFTDEIEHHYAPLDCPVTLLWGEEDQWIPISRGHVLAAKLTRGVLTPVPGAPYARRCSRSDHCRNVQSIAANRGLKASYVPCERDFRIDFPHTSRYLSAARD
jgi:pimeloyl-ACP methyl ester carboxylesterase